MFKEPHSFEQVRGISKTLSWFFIEVCHFEYSFVILALEVTVRLGYHYYDDALHSAVTVPAQLLLSAKKKKQSHYRSVISDIFDGSILSLVQCLTCDRVRCTSHVPTPGRATC